MQVASVTPGSGGNDPPLEGPGLALLRGPRARCGDLESGSGRQSAGGVVGNERVWIFWWTGGSELSLFSASALAPSASELSPVVVVAALWLCPPAPPGSRGHERPWWPRLHPGQEAKVPRWGPCGRERAPERKRSHWKRASLNVLMFLNFPCSPPAPCPPRPQYPRPSWSSPCCGCIPRLHPGLGATNAP